MSVSVEREKPLTFDPHFLAVVATDKELFRRLLPSEVEEFLTNPPEPLSILDELIGDEDDWERERFYQETLLLWKHGADRLHSFIYQRHAQDVGIFTIDATFGKFKQPKSFYGLSAGELKQWNKWLAKAEFDREEIVSALQALGASSSFPKIPKKIEEDRRHIYEAVARSPYKLALAFLPDLTDSEANALFGIFSAPKVRGLAKKR